ncbi:hypothetical protein HOB10_05300 [Candidatus Parcubacteria bacterium]|jgi:hypothetical protein|nr:hypothetical protein [Candidatus Parcubacteria bacterium]
MIKNKHKTFLATLLFFAPLLVKAAELPNPLPAEDIPTVIGFAVKGILGIVGAVALLMLVWGGVTWMTSAGNTDKVKRGKDTIVWAIFGLVAIFMSYAIIRYFFSTLAGTS